MRIHGVNVSFHSVNHPQTWSYPNNYKYPVCTDEKSMGGKYVKVQIMSGELICVDSGSYYDPPIYEPDWEEIIVVQPTLVCWGKGISA